MSARLTRWGPLAATLVAFVAISVIVFPRLNADGTARVASYELDAGQPLGGLRTTGSIARNLYGFTLPPFSSGSVSFAVTLSPRAGERTVLRISASAGKDVSSLLTLVDRSGRHLLGHPSDWLEHEIEITRYARAGRVRIEFSGVNSGAASALLADRVQVASFPPSAIPKAGRGEVALWVGLLVLFVVLAMRRLRDGAPFVVVGALTAYLVWPDVKASAVEPLFSNLWRSSAHASWIGLDHGILSGTFGPLSAVAVQLFHLLTPITGTGAAGARTASMLVGILALAALYVLARTVVGTVAAVGAVTCALIADPFRLSLFAGDSSGTLCLATSVFLLAVYRVLARRDVGSMVTLGVAGAIAILAEPLWWPGVLATILLLAIRAVPRAQRRAALVAGLVALVLVSLPSRISVAHQARGDLNADVLDKTTFARNVEFVGRGHSAPPDQAARIAAPLSGTRVGLGEYVFGDHSLTSVAGGILSGGYDSLAASGARPKTKLAGLLAFIAEIAGVFYVLLVPRVRLVVVVPVLMSLVPWFYASHDGVPHFTAGVAFWTSMVLCAGALADVAWQAARERLPPPRLASVVATRVNAPRRRRSPQAG